MKRAVSISIGSSKRDKAVEVTLLGEKVSIERIGTDGDMEAAALKYKELDGAVDAFGVGGADLGAIIDGKWYTPIDSAYNFEETGIASWYGREWHGRKTSTGETYDMYAMTAAHPTLPIPSYVRVTHLGNGRSVVVRRSR